MATVCYLVPLANSAAHHPCLGCGEASMFEECFCIECLMAFDLIVREWKAMKLEVV